MTTYREAYLWDDEKKSFSKAPPDSSSASSASGGFTLRRNGRILARNLTDLDILGDFLSASVAAGRGFVAGVNGAARSFGLSTGRLSGRPYLWGLNDYGQLGAGYPATASTPTLLSGLSSRVVWVSAGRDHTAVVLSNGTVWAWGRNDSGQLGDGTTTERHTPVQVVGVGGSGVLEDIVAAACGGFHTLFLSASGAVYAVGYNGEGQLGINTTTDSLTPVQVLGIGGSGTLAATAISANDEMSAAVISDGTGAAWGQNSSGCLGDGTTTDRHAPVAVSGLSGLVAVDCALDVFAAWLKSDGSVWCVGENGNGQMGDGSLSDRHTPVRVHGVGDVGFLSDIVTISARGGFVLAGDSSGALYAWGFNGSGQLGDGSTTDRLVPVQVAGVGGTGTLANIRSIGTCYRTSYAVASDGTLYSWGESDNSLLGDGTGTDRSAPAVIGPVAGVSQISGFLSHVILLGDSQEITSTLTASGGIAVLGLPGNSPALSDVGLVKVDGDSGLGAEPTGADSVRLFAKPASTTQRGAVLLAEDGGTTAGTAVQANDSRLAAAGLTPPAMEVLWG